MKKFKVKDHYFNKAKKDNFLARSIYKLEEIDAKFKIIETGNRVVDFGYHPGSWCQYTTRKVGEDGFVVGIDIRPLNKSLLNVKNLKLFEKDIFEVNNVADLGESDKFDVVLSDMAPNTTGMRSVDQDRSMNLIEKVFEILNVFLKKDGNLVIKIFDSNRAQEFIKEIRTKKVFKEIKSLKPKSTRQISKEFFLIGKGYVGE